MNIVVPLSGIHNYLPLVQAGADEFYCGYVPLRWLEKYYYLFPLNRRPFGLSRTNINTETSLKILKRMTERYHVPVKIAFNELHFHPDHYGLVTDIIKSVVDAGFDTIIVSDIGLLVLLARHNITCKIHLSIGSSNLNSNTLGFYDQFNITRYIFPRKISVHTIERILKKHSDPAKEFEVFLLNTQCLYAEQFCNSIHCREFSPLCRVMPRSYRKNPGSGKYAPAWERMQAFNRQMDQVRLFMKENHTRGEQGSGPGPGAGQSFGMNGCGVCRIARFHRMGVRHFKIVGRELSLENMVTDVRTVRKLIDEVKKDSTLTDEEIRKTVFDTCPGFACYYPD